MSELRFALAFLLAAAPIRADGPDWSRRLEAAIERATTRNPEVAEREARIEASRHRIGQATALPDPEIDVGLQDVPVPRFSLSRSDFTMEKVAASQRFPAAGKRPAQKRSAEAEFESASAMHADHVIRIAAEVADAFFSIADIDTRMHILEASRERLKRAAESAAERYRVGKGVQADVLRANLEVTATEERLASLVGERRMRAAQFNALQALPPSTPIDPIAIPENDPTPPASAQLLRDAEATSPAVSAAQAQVRVADEQRTLAHLERRPDLTATGYYAHRIDFDDFVGASVGLNLPFFQPKRLREREAEKESELSGARASLEMVKNEIRRAIEEAYADFERSIEQVRLYRGSILPQAETNAKAAQEAYTVGQIDFLTYVRAAIDLDSYEAELSMRRAGAWRAVAALQKASGLALIAGTPTTGEIHAQN